MEEVVWQKFSQNEELREELLETGDAELFEVRSPKVPDIFPFETFDVCFTSIGLPSRFFLGRRL